MEHYAGIDVSMECSSVCVVNASGKIVREAKVASEPEALIGRFGPLGLGLARIGLEAGPLAQWLYAAMKQAGLAVELLETRHKPDDDGGDRRDVVHSNRPPLPSSLRNGYAIIAGGAATRRRLEG
jgi:hypothetical protein